MHVDFPDNPNEKIEFETMSGVLGVRKQGLMIVMDFPAYKPMQLDAKQKKDAHPLIKGILGDLLPADTAYCPVTKKLLVRLEDFCSRSVVVSLLTRGGRECSIRSMNQEKHRQTYTTFVII